MWVAANGKLREVMICNKEQVEMREDGSGAPHLRLCSCLQGNVKIGMDDPWKLVPD